MNKQVSDFYIYVSLLYLHHLSGLNGFKAELQVAT
jgi:hypothetical protein